MGVKLNINQSAINAKMKDAEEAILQKFLRVLRYCGDQAVNEARLRGNYDDITGNLRSSIGYVIAINGVIITENFEYTKNEEGNDIGKKLAREIAMSKTDIVLVVVAGMKYASHVESKRRDVLTSAEQLANKIIPQLLKDLR